MRTELQRSPPLLASRELTPAQLAFAKAIARDLELAWNHRSKNDAEMLGSRNAELSESSTAMVARSTPMGLSSTTSRNR